MSARTYLTSSGCDIFHAVLDDVKSYSELLLGMEGVDKQARSSPTSQRTECGLDDSADLRDGASFEDWGLFAEREVEHRDLGSSRIADDVDGATLDIRGCTRPEPTRKQGIQYLLTISFLSY